DVIRQESLLIDTHTSPPSRKHVSVAPRPRSRFNQDFLFSLGPNLLPNARFQAPPMAAARNERRLLAVACKPWLGAAPGGTLALPPTPPAWLRPPPVPQRRGAAHPPETPCLSPTLVPLPGRHPPRLVRCSCL